MGLIDDGFCYRLIHAYIIILYVFGRIYIACVHIISKHHANYIFFFDNILLILIVLYVCTYIGV